MDTARRKTLAKIPGQQPDTKVVIKRMSAGEYYKMNSECLKIDATTKAQEIDSFQFVFSLLYYGIEEASFFDRTMDRKTKDDILYNMPRETVDYLFTQCMKFNNIDSEQAAEIKKE